MSAAALSRLTSASNEHYTPPAIVTAARYTLGRIDLDPASCQAANGVVRAKEIFTKDDDGLSRPWFGRVFLNPPGGKTVVSARVGSASTRSRAAAWWCKLAEEYEAGHVTTAIFVGFSIDILQTTQRPAREACLPTPLDFPLCFPSERLEFFRESDGGKLEPGTDPTHANVIAFLPPRNPMRWPIESAIYRFVEAFGPIGRCIPGCSR